MQKREKGQKSQEMERSCYSWCSYCTQLFKKRAKKGIGIRKNSLSLLSNREETEEEEMIAEAGWGSEIEGYEDSSVDIDDILDPA